ncbi:nucleotidyltransferase domain-containing protein [Sutcliffiella cohnii]
MDFSNLFSQLEKEHNFQILFACEAGSRTYGTAGENSDYDIRIIYKRTIKEYLSLKPNNNDSFTYKNGEFDIQGWDLRKALLLAKKSNPSLYEMINGNEYYVANSSLVSSLRTIINDTYSKKVLASHYTQLLAKNIKLYNEKKKSSYLYHSFRSALMIEYMLKFHQLPPIALSQLINSSEMFSQNDLNIVIEIKKNGTISNEDSINRLLKELQLYVVEAKRLIDHLEQLDTNKVQWSSLEHIFLEQIGFKQ